eukprot:6330287-Pyramimonas_sp.AAC.1
MVRRSGKQPRRELITDCFSKRKVIKSIGKACRWCAAPPRGSSLWRSGQLRPPARQGPDSGAGVQ